MIKFTNPRTKTLSGVGRAVFLAAALFTAGSVVANPLSESVALAKTVPIADVHMHLVGRSIDFHRAQMDRNNVRWGGGVGPTDKGYPKPADVSKVLGTRYFFTLGQQEFTDVFFSSGARGLVDPNSSAFARMFSVADRMLESREAYGFGELHIDNSKSFSTMQFARKIEFDNPVVQRIYALADKYQGVVQFHMQGDPANVASLRKKLLEFPNSKTVLSHGLPWSSQPLLRELLEAHPNLYIELSRKGATLNDREAAQAFSKSTGPKENWLKTIEQFPDRFMIGSDTHAPDEERYDAVMQEFREGLLPYLKPETLKNVAYQNAIRVFRLNPDPK